MWKNEIWILIFSKIIWKIILTTLSKKSDFIEYKIVLILKMFPRNSD